MPDRTVAVMQTMAGYAVAYPGFDPAATSQAPNDLGLQNAIAHH
jgi:hypothetical protein